MMRMPSLMTHDFSRVPPQGVPRSTFDRSKGHKTTFDSGYLVPVYCEEVLPGDTINMSFSAFARLATPQHPIMDNMFLDWMAFFVPNRLVWDNWEKFNGQQDNPGDSTDFLVPVIDTTGFGGYAVGSLQDYLGLIPGATAATFAHTNLACRGYNLIFNEWIRDQNIQDSVVVNKDDGPDDPDDYVLLRRGKRHDYFTSALPFAQKGTEVAIPIGTSAPVWGDGKAITLWDGTNRYGMFGLATGNVSTYTGAADSNVGFTGGAGTTANSKSLGLATEASGGQGSHVYADLSAAADVTINALRVSIAMQQFLELDARGGTRYTEIIRAHFGVVSPDARLQRPEFLGGGSQHVNITPIAQQSETTVDSPQGNLAALGTVTVSRTGFSKSFTEHGIVFILVSVRADLSYQQGFDRMWSRRSREEFYWPTFANLGEQAVLNKEIYWTGDPATDDGVFGYQERYAEYRYGKSLITGLFRSDVAGSLDVWHLAQDFAEVPTLSPEFIEDNPPVDRVIAVPAEPHFIADFYFKARWARPMPVFSVPGLLRL